MKSQMFLLLALAALVFSPGANGQQPLESGPVPVVITPTRLQYKVLDLGRIAPGANMAASDTLEGILNQMAAQGWKVVSSTGSFLILSRNA